MAHLAVRVEVRGARFAPHRRPHDLGQLQRRRRDEVDHRGQRDAVVVGERLLVDHLHVRTHRGQHTHASHAHRGQHTRTVTPCVRPCRSHMHSAEAQGGAWRRVCVQESMRARSLTVELTSCTPSGAFSTDARGACVGCACCPPSGPPAAGGRGAVVIGCAFAPTQTVNEKTGGDLLLRRTALHAGADTTCAACVLSSPPLRGEV
jgi:hypothetical protein